MALECVSAALKQDKDVIYAALTQNGNALWHLPLNILNEDIVLAYAYYSKCPAKLTPFQSKGLFRYVTQKRVSFIACTGSRENIPVMHRVF